VNIAGHDIVWGSSRSLTRLGSFPLFLPRWSGSFTSMTVPICGFFATFYSAGDTRNLRSNGGCIGLCFQIREVDLRVSL